MKRALISVCAALALPPAVLAQCASQLSMGASWTRLRTGGSKGQATYQGRPRLQPVITNAAYSAECISEIVQTLADGTRITKRAEPTKLYRDSLGRTRFESVIARLTVREGVPALPNVVEILDPLTGYAYILDTVGKVAHRIPIDKTPRPQPPFTGPFPPVPGAEVKTESIGAQVIEGVAAVGERSTMVMPVGMRGNNEPLILTSETWRSPELNRPILTRMSTPNGVQTIQLIHLSRLEPSTSLFQPPPDYKAVDEAGEFTIYYSLPD